MSVSISDPNLWIPKFTSYYTDLERQVEFRLRRSKRFSDVGVTIGPAGHRGMLRVRLWESDPFVDEERVRDFGVFEVKVPERSIEEQARFVAARIPTYIRQKNLEAVRVGRSELA